MYWKQAVQPVVGPTQYALPPQVITYIYIISELTICSEIVDKKSLFDLDLALVVSHCGAAQAAVCRNYIILKANL